MTSSSRKLKIVYTVPMFSQECEGSYGRFHDVIHTLQQMDDPLWEYTIVPLRRYYGKPSPNVLFQNGNKPFRLVNYLRNVARASREADIVHIVQGDFPYSLLMPLMVSNRAPLVVGPNVTVGVDVERTAKLSRKLTNPGTKLQYRLKVARPYRNKWVFNRYSPISLFYKRFVTFIGYRHDVIHYGGVKSKKVVVLPSGVRTDIFNPEGERVTRDTPLLVLYIGDGRRTYEKGADIFLKGLQYLKQKEFPFRALIIGRETPELEQLIRHSGLIDQVEPIGFVPRAALAPFYRGADVHVCSSRYETDGNTAMESISCGTPVIRTERVGLTGLSKMLEFEVGNTQQLGERLVEVYQNKEYYKKLALEEQGQWDIKFVIQKFYEVYQEVLREKI